MCSGGARRSMACVPVSPTEELPMRTLSRLVAAGVALVAAAALAAPAAQADSIAYVKGGDVWLSTSDGERQFQVTSTGAYQDVSQADDGTMIALSGVRLHKLDRMGNVLADFDTPVSDTRPPAQRVFWGPLDPAISPDGKQVAYSWYYMTQSQDPTCYPPECYTTINEAGTGYSHSDRQTGWDEPGFKKHGGWRNPVWVDNSTTLISDMTHWPNTEVTVDDRTATDNQARLWFTDDLTGNPSGNATEGDITRDTKRMAYVTGESEESLTLYYVPVFPREFRDNEPYPKGSAFPVSCYRYGTPAGGRFRSPTFSPSGGKLAWADSEGVKVVDVPDFAAAGNCTADGASQTSSMLIPGAAEPDWGPADVPTGRPGKGGDGPKPGPGGGGLSAKVSKVKLAKALKRGVTVTLAVPSAGKVSATAKARGRKVAAARSRAVSAGTASVKLTFTAKGRAALKRARKATLIVAVKFTPQGGAAQTTAAKVTLKR